MTERISKFWNWSSNWPITLKTRKGSFAKFKYCGIPAGHFRARLFPRSFWPLHCVARRVWGPDYMANQIWTGYSTPLLGTNAPWQHVTFWYSRIPLQNNHTSSFLLNTRGWCNRALPIPSPHSPLHPSSLPLLTNLPASWGPVQLNAVALS